MPPISPEVSIVVTTYDRPNQLSTMLEALARQEFQTDRFEVVVVDDGSPNSVEPTVNGFSDRLQLRFLRQANSGPAAGRNLGIANARGRLIAFTDDDCLPAPGWLANLVLASGQHPDCMLGGHVVNGLRDAVCSEAAQMILDNVYRFCNRDPVDARFFTSNNMACPAEQLRRLGGFDASFRTAEDRNLCERWRQAGHRLVFVPDMVITHFHRLNLRSFWRMYFQYGRGAARFHRVRSATQSSGFRDYFGVYSYFMDWLFRPFREASVMRAFALDGLLVVWQVANAAGFLYESLSRKASS